VEPSQTEDGRPGPLDPGVLRAATRRWDGTLDKTLRSAVIPYGYTVTTWATGAYLVGQRGLPSGFEAFIFVCGAIVAFAMLSVLSARRSGSGDLMATETMPIHPDSTHPILIAGVHVIAVGVAFAAAAAVDQLSGNAAWFVGSFTVTLVYLGLSSLELAIAIEMHRREIGLDRARVIVRRQRAVIRDAVRRR
jgi:type IV secretory pathway TrbD component